MSLQDLLSLSGTPYLDVAVGILVTSYQTIENVNVYKQQCRDLGGRCVKLLLALRDSSVGLEGQRAVQFADEMTDVIRRVNRKVNYWAGLGKLKSFLQQREIKDGIESLHRDIEAAMNQFHIQNHMELARTFLEAREIEQRDRREIRELLKKIVNEDMAIVNNTQNSEQVEQIMESIQRELSGPDLQPAEKKAFKKSLWELHQRTSRLPPLVNLTGQIALESDKPVARGTFNDIYTGKWLDKEKVALRLPRLKHDPRLEERFQHEVTVWRELKHPNIVPLYGIVYICNDLYYVSPWMDNGTAMDYVRTSSTINCVGVLHDVAKGLEYLHSFSSPIVHGDLRGQNVLISANGVACLSDFGLSKFLEDAGSEPSCGPSPRWLAPELFRPDGILSTHSDVWSFGMVCLEILTGEHPFSSVKSVHVVQHEIEHGKLPQRPLEIFSRNGLTKDIWKLMKQCWNKKPKSRPSMTDIRIRLEEILKSPENLHFSFQRPSTAGSDNGSLSPISIISSFNSPTRSLRKYDSNSLRSVEDTRLKTGSALSSGSKSPPRLELLVPVQSTPSNTSVAHSTSPVTFTEAEVYIPNILVEERLGTIFAGTLEGLIDRLIYSFDHLNDSEYQDTFFTTCIDFTTWEDFFELLVKRFYAVDQDRNIHTADRVNLQYNIFKVLIYWLTSPKLRISSRVLQEMTDFCEHRLRGNISPAMAEKAELVLQMIYNKSLQHRSYPSPNRKVPKSDEISPHNLAIALTILEGDIYRDIFSPDYIAHLKGLDITPNNIERASFINNKIALWVKQTIIQCDGVNDRAQALTFFINTAVECRKLRNFASLAAIGSVVNSTTIERLKRTHEFLDPAVKRELRNLEKILNPLNPALSRHQRYWEALGQQVEHEPLDKCIPWLPVHLFELRAVLEGNPPELNINGCRMINFQRCVVLMDRMKEILYYKAPDVEHYRQHGSLAYLEHVLGKVDPNVVTEDKLEARSRYLAEQEKREHRGGEHELRYLGFNV